MGLLFNAAGTGLVGPCRLCSEAYAFYTGISTTPNRRGLDEPAFGSPMSTLDAGYEASPSLGSQPSAGVQAATETKSSSKVFQV